MDKLDFWEIIKELLPIIGVVFLTRVLENRTNDKPNKTSLRSLMKIRFISIVILIFCFICYFVPADVKGSQISLWYLSNNHNASLAYLAIVGVVGNIILFLSKSKTAYLLGVSVFILNIIPLVGAVNPIQTVPITFPLFMITYIGLMLVFLIYGLTLNPSLTSSPGIQIVIRVKKLTFEYLALYIPMVLFGFLFLILSIQVFLVRSLQREELIYGIGGASFGILIIITSILSLIPKKKRD